MRLFSALNENEVMPFRKTLMQLEKNHIKWLNKAYKEMD